MNKLIIDDVEINLSDETVAELKDKLGVEDKDATKYSDFFTFCGYGVTDIKSNILTYDEVGLSFGEKIAEDSSVEVWKEDGALYFRLKE